MGAFPAKRLMDWYRRSKRDLPWRRTRDPYCIWIAEVMLQQTRVAAVIPYYERFIQRFPDVQSLASAPEEQLLAVWAGLGYYSRARNLQKAARLIAVRGAFPADYESIRALPGVGDYTAAAVASIAFGLPHAVVDGNVRRVFSRFAAGEGEVNLLADELLDPRKPGDFNQAVMELGAMVCLPKRPKCAECPLARDCLARKAGMPEQFPARAARPKFIRKQRTLLLIRDRSRLLLCRRGDDARRLAGFWELPEASGLPDASLNQRVGKFRHSIVNHDFHITVWEAALGRKPRAARWIARRDLARLPLSTEARKALRLAGYDL